MSNSDIILCSHSPWSGVSSSLFILYRWFYARYILVNRVCHVIVYPFWGKSRTLLCTLVLVYPCGRYYVLPCYSLIIASFIAFFSSSWVISCTHGGLHASRWIYHSLKLFLLSWCLWPWELQIHVNLELSSLIFRNKSHPSFLVGGCTGPFLQFKCTSCMVRTIS